MKTKIINNIDEYLGDSSSRFFGEGYKKVKYQINDEQHEDHKVESGVSIEYTKDWSLKKKRQLKPHLSSIDSIIISANLCGSILLNDHGKVEGFSIANITIVAGHAPLVELSDIRAMMKLVKVQDEGDVPIYVFSGYVGEMNISIEVVYDHENSHSIVEPLLDKNYINDYFSSAKHAIKKVKYKNDRANAMVEKYNVLLKSEVIDVVDAFVISMQMGQVLLYEYDHLRREDSNNLWMRSIRIERHHKKASTNKIITMLDNVNLSRLEDASWRSASIVSKVDGINVSCSVAHQLPLSGDQYVC